MAITRRKAALRSEISSLRAELNWLEGRGRRARSSDERRPARTARRAARRARRARPEEAERRKLAAEIEEFDARIAGYMDMMDMDHMDEPMDHMDEDMMDEPMESMDDYMYASEEDPSGVEEEITQDSLSEVVDEAAGGSGIADADLVVDVAPTGHTSSRREALRRMKRASKRLDRVAAYLEKTGRLKMAFRIDTIADSVDARVKHIEEVV